MSPAQIRATIEELRHATRPEQRTAYERALIALADLVDETIFAIGALRAAVPQQKETP